VVPSGSLKLVPTTRLYDRSNVVLPSHLLEQRIARPSVRIHPRLAETLKLKTGDQGTLTLNQNSYSVEIVIDQEMADNAGLVPRSVGIPISHPLAAILEKRTPETQENNEDGS
jgi:hypothetical protein